MSEKDRSYPAATGPISMFRADGPPTEATPAEREEILGAIDRLKASGAIAAGRVAMMGLNIVDEERRGREDMMKRDALPWPMSDEDLDAVRAMGIAVGWGPGSAEKNALLPRRWTKVAHPVDHRRYWVLDERNVRRMVVFWKATPGEAPYGSIGVLPENGPAYMPPRDEELLRLNQMTAGLRCRCCNLNNIVSVDCYELEAKPSWIARVWERIEHQMARHQSACGRIRLALVPSDQKPGTPPVFRVARTADTQDGQPARDYMQVENPARYDFAPARPAGSIRHGLRWKKHPPSKRRKMMSWLETGSAAKARYEPVRRAVRRLGYLPSWALASWQRAAPPPAFVLHAYQIEIPRTDKAMAILYAETEPSEEVQDAVRRLARRKLCQHVWSPVGPAHAYRREVSCLDCHALGQQLPSGEVVLYPDPPDIDLST